MPAEKMLTAQLRQLNKMSSIPDIAAGGETIQSFREAARSPQRPGSFIDGF